MLFGQNSVRFFDETALAANTYKKRAAKLGGEMKILAGAADCRPCLVSQRTALKPRVFYVSLTFFLRTFCKATAYNYLRKWVRP